MSPSGPFCCVVLLAVALALRPSTLAAAEPPPRSSPPATGESQSASQLVARPVSLSTEAASSPSLGASPSTGPGLTAYLFVAAVLFVAGLVCMTAKRNGIGVLMGVELILNAGTLNLMAFSRFTPLGLDGQIFALFVIVLAAAEAAIALAIALNFYNNHLTIDIDRAQQLQH